MHRVFTPNVGSRLVVESTSSRVFCFTLGAGYADFSADNVLEMAESLQEWAKRAPKPFPFEDGDLVRGRSSGCHFRVSGRLLIPIDLGLSAARALTSGEAAAGFEKVGRLDDSL